MVEVRTSQQRKKIGSYKRKLILLILAQTFLVVSIIVASTTLSTQATLKNNLESSSNSIINEIDHSILFLIDGIKSSVNYFSNKESVKELLITDAQVDAVLQEFGVFSSASDNILNIYAASESKEMYLYPKIELSADFDPTIRGWYKGALATDDVYVEDPYIDAGTGKVVFTI